MRFGGGGEMMLGTRKGERPEDGGFLGKEVDEMGPLTCERKRKRERETHTRENNKKNPKKIQSKRFFNLEYRLMTTALCTCIYIYYIHPELRIEDCRSGSGKGAGPL